MTASLSWKKVGVLLVVAFIVYFILRSPQESALVTREIASGIGNFFSSLAVALTTFLQTLF